MVKLNVNQSIQQEVPTV